ncbi:MAG: hypothetical protein WBA10_10310, partial [Elainellaceae cyanobacterium]
MTATTCFQSSRPSCEAAPFLLANPNAADPHNERIRHIVIGSPAGVRETIHMLHVLNYSEQIHWTKLLAIPETGLTLRPELGQVFSHL